ncbi:MAG TPA: hypothetical protein VGP82_20110 [Ktedonobacterales bacterium]|nr:hypothetical protein [Ktedonobacterales bacterium]
MTQYNVRRMGGDGECAANDLGDPLAARARAGWAGVRCSGGSGGSWLWALAMPIVLLAAAVILSLCR